MIKCDYAHNGYSLYCSAGRDPTHMQVNNKSTPIQYKQARERGPYPEGRLLTPHPQPPCQKLSACTARLHWPAVWWFPLGTFNKHWKHWEPLLGGWGGYPMLYHHWRAVDPAWDSRGQLESTKSVNLVSEVPASPGCISQWSAERYIQPLSLGSTMPLATLLHFSPFKMWCPVSYWDWNS